MKKLFFIFSMLLTAFCNAQTVTEVIYPKYVQGVGTGNPPDDRKVPFACRMTINGLTPDATYRYYSRFVQDPTLPTNGQGFYIIANKTGDFTRITSATLGVPGRYGEFTTDASGSATDWFVVEPSSAIDYQPGTQLYWRILLNNGAGGVSVVNRATAPNAVTVLGFGSGSSQGTGLRSTPVPALTAKNFVFLYENEEGTGRPEAGTFVESDGTDNNAGANGYAPFYGNSVDGVDKAFGTIIPNNLSTGVRNISQYSLASGALVNSTTTADGVFPTTPSGNVTTANANSGLDEIVIDGAGVTFVDPTPLCNLVVSSTQTAIACNGDSSTVVISVTGGTSPYTGTGSFNQAAGTQTYIISDAKGCVDSTTVTVSQPAALVASNTASVILCNGDSSNVIISAAGGTAPYTGTGSFTQAAGTQIYTVTDANGCSAITTVTVSQPATLVASSTQTPVVGGTSEVTIAAEGGTTPYTGTGSFTQAAGTTESYTVTDANGCTSTISVTVNDSAQTVPSVSISIPYNTTVYTAPAKIKINAAAIDEDGTITKVEFYNGTTLLDTEELYPYGFFWVNVPVGSYTLTAKATDNDGNVATSNAIEVSVVTNTAPTVSITLPPDNVIYGSPASVYISATASDEDGSIAKVAFYNGTDLLDTEYRAPYGYLWKDVPAGNYTLTAVATDNSGLSSTSAEVQVSVVNSTTPMVSITSPADNTVFSAPASIKINATASDPDGVNRVEFYNGSTLLHTEYKAAYTYNWNNVPTGNYTLSVKSVNNNGAVTTSNSVQVSVVDNNAPSVTIVTPSNNETFEAPAIIGLSADAEDADGTISKVEFYVNGDLAATEYSFPYRYLWSDVQAGTYTITAKATDNSGAETTSDEVTITVTGAGAAIAGNTENTPGVSKSVSRKADLSNMRLELKLSPNPVNNTLNVFIKGQPNKKSDLYILSSSGVVIKHIRSLTSTQVPLNVSSLVNGVYIIKVISGDKVMYRQFIKL